MYKAVIAVKFGLLKEKMFLVSYYFWTWQKRPQDLHFRHKTTVYSFFFFLVQCHNFLFKKKLDKFVLKIQISRRVSYFVGFLSGVRDIFLPSGSQIFSQLNLRFRVSLNHLNIFFSSFLSCKITTNYGFVFKYH